ncbi:FG-GAP repeat domain-containing protein [Streptomyces sp. NPDC051555]|uniref:FG-GAP repeat domain-containing protein n=1 Tax=Streptomyces sp. NPDC051555 TaxID=3365657 RepID=UPI00379CD6E8
MTAHPTRTRPRVRRAVAALGTLTALITSLAAASPAAAQPTYPDNSLATTNTITRISTSGIGMRWNGDAEATRAAAYEAAHPALTRTTPSALIDQASTTAARPLCHATNIGGATGFCWSPGDDTSSSWIPQGVGATTVGSRKLLVTSWYGPDATERLTFADVTDPAAVRYRHVQLVGLTPDGTGYAPLTGHANAVVWAGNRLYVASTGSGFDVFDTSGIWGTAPDTYVLPRTGSYSYTGSGTGCGTYAGVTERPCITSASLDLSGPQPALVTAEMDPYRTGSAAFDLAAAPVVRYPVDAATGVLKADGTGRVQASDAFSSPIGGTQGVAMRGGGFALSAPCPEFVEGGTEHLPSCLYRGEVGEPVWLVTRTGIYNENLAYLPGSGELWMVNERPGARTVVKTTWPAAPALAGMVHRTAADFTGDRLPDTLGVEASTGKLWLYPGTSGGGLGNRVQIGSGWGDMTALAAGDFTGDGKADLIALEKATGTLQLYPGTGSAAGMNTLGNRIRIGTNWSGMRDLTAIDVDQDSKPDLLAIDAAGALWAYPGTGAGGLGDRVRIGTGWHAMAELASPGDLNSDGKPDLVAVDHDGALWAYPATGTLGGSATLGGRTLLGSNWNTMRQLVGADFDNDGKGDLSAVEAPATATGNLYLYRGTGTTALGSRTQTGTNW